jgi:hypothetical protein
MVTVIVWRAVAGGTGVDNLAAGLAGNGRVKVVENLLASEREEITGERLSTILLHFLLWGNVVQNLLSWLWLDKMRGTDILAAAFALKKEGFGSG